MTWIAVAVGGAIGSLARHAVNVLFSHRLLRLEPYGTAAVNVAGSLAIGIIAGLVAGERLHMAPRLRTFVFVGILGGFTTFSTLMLDTFTLAHSGRTSAAVANLLGQIVIGYVAAYVGFRLAA